jgi:hypothetical protein
VRFRACSFHIEEAFMALSYSEELSLLLIDKGVIGVLVLVAGFALNKMLKRGELERTLTNEMQTLQTTLANDLKKLGASKRLEFAERQLSEFYWPLYVRSFTLSALRSLRRSRGSASGANIRGIAEQESTILADMALVFNKSVHLMESDDQLFQAMLKLCQYEAARRAEIDQVVTGEDPDHLAVLWPDKLQQLLVSASFRLQKQYDDMVARADHVVEYAAK